MRIAARGALSLACALVLILSGAAGTDSATAGTCGDPTIVPTTTPKRVGMELTGQQAACAPPATGLFDTVTLDWLRCNDAAGTDCPTVVAPGAPNADNVTYTPVLADRGKFLALRQTADYFSPVEPDSVTTRMTGPVFGTGPPNAAFTRTPAVVKRGVPVGFNAGASSDPDGDTLQYNWAWGDGTSSVNAGPTPSHSYSTSGTKSVTLTVIDDDGETDTASLSVSVKFPPVAGFVFGPKPVRVGQFTAFQSTSSDPENDPLSYSWDLNGDGQFGDATTRSVGVTFRSAGSKTIALRVTADGETSTVFRTIPVEAALPVPTTPTTPTTPTGPTTFEPLRPFPVVVIAGRFTSGGVLITRLAVRAPRNSRVRIVCKGRGCPRRVGRRKVGRSRKLRLRSYQRRMKAGTVIKLYIRKKGKIGKYTRFRIRPDAPPARRDRCLVPGKKRPVRCSTVT